ncbi:MAG: inositol 2-dehydrogenase [Oscillospiraceae bacterium]|nr:inositol 2-dehydrogenase [Oscillospiraceae bacterium]
MTNLGIIGAGRIGKLHAESISQRLPGACVKLIADPFMNDDTRDWAKKLGIGGCAEDYRELLHDPSIDAVLICSSTDTHAPISLEVIAAGKHVFCEKPVSQDLGEILKVKDALKNSSVKYQVGFNRRFDHNFKAVRTAIEQGQIGTQRTIKITSRDPGPPPISYIETSGGMFMDMTIHDFDMLRYLAGCEADTVFVQAANLVDPAIGTAGDIDTALITITMKNGAIALIDNCREASYGYDQRVEVLGSLGQIATGNDTLSTAVLSTAGGVCAEKPLHFFLERYMDSFVQEMKEFISAIEDDLPVPVGIEDGLQSVLMAMAAQRSLKEGRPVSVEK